MKLTFDTFQWRHLKGAVPRPNGEVVMVHHMILVDSTTNVVVDLEMDEACAHKMGAALSERPTIETATSVPGLRNGSGG